MMRRVMIQADEELLGRARDEARRRGISLARLAREALARELDAPARPRTRLIGAFDSQAGGFARRSAEEDMVPPPWRSS